MISRYETEHGKEYVYGRTLCKDVSFPRDYVIRDRGFVLSLESVEEAKRSNIVCVSLFIYTIKDGAWKYLQVASEPVSFVTNMRIVKLDQIETVIFPSVENRDAWQ